MTVAEFLRTTESIRLAQQAETNALPTGGFASPLAGKLIDELGQALTPTHAVKQGRRQLRQDSEHSLAIQLRPPPATTALAPIKSPPGLTDVAKATDQLSREQSLAEQTKELFAYGQEVRDELKKDQKSKAAESSLAQGAPKTVPNKPK